MQMDTAQENMLIFGIILVAIAFVVIPILTILGVNLTIFLVSSQLGGAGVFQAILGGTGIIFIVLPFFMKKPAGAS